MSHIAVYRVDMKKLNFNAIRNQSFINAMKTSLEKIFNKDITSMSSSNTIEFKVGEYGLNIIFTKDGEVLLRGDTDYIRYFGGREAIMKKIKQSIVLSVQLKRYKKYRVKYQNNKLIATVIA